RRAKIVNMILLYIIFQTFFNWVLYMTGDYDNLQFTYGEPHFHLWYIVSLGVWYVIALIINHLQLSHFGKWVFFIVLFAVSFISRWYTDDLIQAIEIGDLNITSYTLSYQRTLSFMPFFFVGFFMNKAYMERV